MLRGLGLLLRGKKKLAKKDWEHDHSPRVNQKNNPVSYRHLKKPWTKKRDRFARRASKPWNTGGESGVER